MPNMLANSYLFTDSADFEQYHSFWSHFSDHLANASPVFILLLVQFWSPPNPEKNIWI